MKTAISIPDDVFKSADVLAAELSISRSQLYANAVAEYVAKHRSADTTTRLNQVYSDAEDGVDPGFRAAQHRTLRSEVW